MKKDFKIYKRDNPEFHDVAGIPVFQCDRCRKRFQSLGIAKNHNCRGIL